MQHRFIHRGCSSLHSKHSTATQQHTAGEPTNSHVASAQATHAPPDNTGRAVVCCLQPAAGVKPCSHMPAHTCQRTSRDTRQRSQPHTSDTTKANATICSSMSCARNPTIAGHLSAQPPAPDVGAGRLSGHCRLPPSQAAVRRTASQPEQASTCPSAACPAATTAAPAEDRMRCNAFLVCNQDNLKQL